MTIAEKLACIRKCQNVDIKQVAKHTGIDVKKLRSYESGKLIPDEKTLEIFAEAYNIRIGILTAHCPLDSDERLRVMFEAFYGKAWRDSFRDAIEDSLQSLTRYPYFMRFWPY